jgi:hypothetical protein
MPKFDITREIVISIEARDEANAEYLASLSESNWESWDWKDERFEVVRNDE